MARQTAEQRESGRTSPRTEVADVLRAYGEMYGTQHVLTQQQARSITAHRFK